MLEIEMLLDQPGSDERIHRMIDGLAAVVKRGALCAEIDAAGAAQDLRTAAEERAAGRLH